MQQAKQTECAASLEHAKGHLNLTEKAVVLLQIYNPMNACEGANCGSLTVTETQQVPFKGHSRTLVVEELGCAEACGLEFCFVKVSFLKLHMPKKTHPFLTLQK